MTLEQFNHLAQQGYNRIPVSREVLADLDTPLSAYLKLADGAYSYLFESVHGGEQWGRYSIIGLPCKTVVKINGTQIRVEKDGVLLETLTHDNPLVWIEQFKQRYNVPDIADLPRFNGVWSVILVMKPFVILNPVCVEQKSPTRWDVLIFC